MSSLIDFFNNQADESKGLSHKNNILKRSIIAYMATNGEATLAELTKELKISVITTTRAYNELSDEGFIISVSGKGYFVAPKNNELLRERMIFEMEQAFETAVESGRNAGLKDEEIIDALKGIMEG